MVALKRKPAPSANWGAGLGQRYRTSHFSNSSTPKPRFRPDRLPDVGLFYRQQFEQLKSSGKGWALTRCPFHEERNASFAIHLERGAFICHACGVKGGDLVDFVRMRDGCDFVAACKSLGAWS